MPDVTTSFVASFDTFYAAVDKAVVQLKSFEDQTKNVDKAMNRMGESFSGRKVVQDATMMVEAIEQIGGVSKLTDAELQKVGRTVAEAAEKMKKLGIEVPPAFNDVLKATEGVKQANDETGVSFTTLVGSYVTGQAIIGAATKAWELFTGVLTDGIAEATEAEAINAKLTAALRAQGTDLPSVQTAFDDYAAALEQTTVHSADAIKSTEAMLVLVGDVMPKDMEKALQATLNLADSGIGLEQATDLVAKAAQGNSKALEKQGIALDDTRVKSEGFDYVLNQINETMTGQSAAAAATFEGRLKQLGNAWSNVLESVGKVLTQNATLLKAFELLTSGVGTSTNAVDLFQTATDFVSGVIITAAKAVGVLLTAFDYLQSGYFALRVLNDKIVQGFLTFGIAILKVSQAISKAASYIPGFGDSMGAAAHDAGESIAFLSAAWDGYQQDQDAAIASTKAWSSNIASLNGVVGKFTNELERTRGKTVQLTAGVQQNENAWNGMSGAAAAAAKAAEEGAKAAEEANKKATTEAEKAAEAQKALELKVRGVEFGFFGVSDAVGSLGTKWPPISKDMLDSTDKLAKKLVEIEQGPVGPTKAMEGLGVTTKEVYKTSQSFADFMATDFSKTLIAAFTGGGNALQSLGGAMASFFTGKDSGISKAVEKIPGFFGDALGSVVPVLGTMLGGLAGKLFGKLFDDPEKQINPIRQAFVDAAGGLGELNEQAAAAGVTLRQLLDAKNPKEYEAAIKSLTTAFEFQKTSMAALDETTKRYGFTLEELGPAMQRQELDQQAQQLFRDWEVLNAAGIDTIAITERMSDSVNDYVNDALAMGSEVPAAMEPMLRSMVEAGQLTDAAGNTITSLEDAGISFALTMSDGFKALIGEVSKLTDAIARGLGLAIDRTTKDLRNIPQTIPVSIVYDDPGFEPRGGTVYHEAPEAGDIPGYQGGTKGKYVDFGSESLVRLHGKEAIVPEGDPLGLGAAAGGTGSAPVVVNIDARGALFNDPGSDLRLAERINQALSAKHGLTNKRRAA